MNATYDWPAIYQYWKLFEENYPGTSDPNRYRSVEVNVQRPGPLSYCNWVNRFTEEASVQKDVKTLKNAGTRIGTEWSKGVRLTAELLTNCKTEEERAAVWISASMLTWIRNGTESTITVQNAAEIAIQSNALFARQYGFWGEHLRSFFPMPIVLRLLLNEANQLSTVKLIEIAAASAHDTLTHYTPVKYIIRTF